MSSEEEDYMSDTFLQKCQDVRPGLAPKYSQKKNEKKRKDESPRDQRNPSISKKKLESHQREKGMNTEISSSSKGFLLLQKMGYTPGTGIGKTGEGRTEPVRIQLKSGREGLGAEMERKRKSLEMNERRAYMAAKRQKHSENQTQSFITRMKDVFAEKNMEKDLKTAQAACFQLDQRQGIAKPEEPFFWPNKAFSVPEIDEDEVDEHFSESEIENSARTAFQVDATERLFDDFHSDSDDAVDSEFQSDLPATDKLEILTAYLRKTYRYCIWCGTAYDDDVELRSQCPGNSADIHD